MTMHPFHDFCRRTLDDIRAEGRYRSFTPLRKVATRYPVHIRPDGTEVLIWSSNDYLGMGCSRVAVDAACEAARAMGVGAGGTRNISGTNRLHEDLEAELAISMTRTRRCCSRPVSFPARRQSPPFSTAWQAGSYFPMRRTMRR
jgi:7-keto-8-aminopelargonate synthetase-like enzyme